MNVFNNIKKENRYVNNNGFFIAKKFTKYIYIFIAIIIIIIYT